VNVKWYPKKPVAPKRWQLSLKVAEALFLLSTLCEFVSFVLNFGYSIIVVVVIVQKDVYVLSVINVFKDIYKW
jgi:hypothetical protein